MPGAAGSTSARWAAARWLVCLASACTPAGIFDADAATGGEKPDPLLDLAVDSGGGGSGAEPVDGGVGTADSGAVGSGAADASGSGGSGGAADGGVDFEPIGSTVTTNLFSALLGISRQEVDAKLTLAVERVFGIGTGEPSFPTVSSGYRLYYELPQDPTKAFIWAPDSADVRSEGMSYGMMIAVQMDLQLQFDRLWAFAQTYSQYPPSDPADPWDHYFRWTGTVDVSNPSNWVVNYGAKTGPAPDGEEYFAAALYLAHRRWGSDGAVDYLAHANALASAMLNNPTDMETMRTPVFRQDNGMVVFYPEGGAAEFSDPSYHLPAFYELFALDGPEADRQRWREIAEVSRQYLVTSAHASTGLHPDYANFDGTPKTGYDLHHMFRYDAWRVVMNMGLDYAWFSGDARMKAQTEKYHEFFSTRLSADNVQDALFALDGSSPSGNGSTALTATLAAGALASEHPIRTELVDNLWNVRQQSGPYRYYQQTVYLLGLLCAGGRFAREWPE